VFGVCFLGGVFCFFFFFFFVFFFLGGWVVGFFFGFCFFFFFLGGFVFLFVCTQYEVVSKGSPSLRQSFGIFLTVLGPVPPKSKGQ